MEKEYEILRAEIERRSTVQQAIFVLNLTAVGALVALALRENPSASAPTRGTSVEAPLDSLRGYLLVLFIPCVGFALARLWLDHHEAVARAGRYIRTTLEPRSAASWETHLEAQGRSTRANHYMFFIAYTVAFAGPGVVALVATGLHAHGVERWMLWATAVVLQFLNLVGWKMACWPARERSVSLPRLRTMFEGRVRTRLDWDRLAEVDGVEVAAYFVDEHADYDGWWIPWYYRVNQTGARVEVQEEDGGCAIRLLDCGRLPTLADGSWVPKVQTVAEFEPEVSNTPLKFDVCVYAVALDSGDVARIILDGNHHFAAALRSGRSFAARVFEIRNGPPLDTKVLQDLGRDWATDGGRSEPPGTPGSPSDEGLEAVGER